MSHFDDDNDMCRLVDKDLYQLVLAASLRVVNAGLWSHTDADEARLFIGPHMLDSRFNVVWHLITYHDDNVVPVPDSEYVDDGTVATWAGTGRVKSIYQLARKIAQLPLNEYDKTEFSLVRSAQACICQNRFLDCMSPIEGELPGWNKIPFNDAMNIVVIGADFSRLLDSALTLQDFAKRLDITR